MTDEDTPERLREAKGLDGIERVRDITLGTARAEDYSASDTVPVSDASVGELMGMLESPDAPTRRRATLALAERDGERDVLRALESLARTDQDDEVRQFAIEAVAKLDGDIGVARHALESDEDPWVRAEAVVSLKRSSPDEHVDAFEAALDDPHSAVRRNALISLHHVRDEGSREVLVRALGDESDRVREWAVRLLGQFDDEQIVDVLAEHVENETADIVREAALHALDGGATDGDPWDGTGQRRAGAHVLNRPPGR